MLADSPEDFERCLVGRVHFLREQLFTAVGEIEPQRHEHKRESKQTSDDERGSQWPTWPASQVGSLPDKNRFSEPQAG